MDIDVTFAGYRCFSPHHPATLSLRGDRVALVGVNNSGKSTLLKGVYEFRAIFEDLSQASGMMTASLKQGAPFRKRPETGDVTELFWHFGQNDLLLEVVLPNVRAENPEVHVWKAQIRIAHSSNQYFVTFFGPHGKTTEGKNVHIDQAANLKELGLDLGNLQVSWLSVKWRRGVLR